MMAFGVTAWTWGAEAAALQCAGDVADRCTTPLIELPPAERRRLNPLTSFALHTAERLLGGRPRELLRQTPLVVGSADGDGAVLLRLLRALREHQPLSPTQFHNSVHNAPAGYWSIGLSSTSGTTAIAAGADTLEVALAEAGMLAAERAAPALMLFASLRFPEELAAARPDVEPLAVAAWCEPLQPHSGWRCRLEAADAGNDSGEDAGGSVTLAQALTAQGASGLRFRRFVPRLGHVMAIDALA